MATIDNSCGACGSTVTGAATVAFNKKYHPNCFRCETCGDALTGEFYDYGGRAYCRRDFETKHLHPCGICHRPIEGGTIDDREGNYYHDTCFICERCNGSVVDGYFYVGGKRLCAVCKVSHNVDHAPVMKEMGHCAVCCKRFNAGEEYSSVKDLKYHPSCIKCHYCKKIIEEAREKYEYEQVTQILLNFCCQNCLSAGRPDRCFECNKIIIVNSNTTEFGRTFHTKCFKCSKCSRVIATSESYVKSNNRAICKTCA